MNQVSKIIIIIIKKKKIKERSEPTKSVEHGEREVERILFYFYFFLRFFLRFMEIGP